MIKTFIKYTGQRLLQWLLSLVDPCDNFHCKRGKMCKLDANNKPRCVCQEPSKCPHSVNEFDHVSLLNLLRAKL